RANSVFHFANAHANRALVKTHSCLSFRRDPSVSSLHYIPLRTTGAGVRVPHPAAARIGIAIVSRLDPLGQGIELLGISAAQDNVVRDEGELQLGDAKENVPHPFLFPEGLETGFAEILF